MPEDFCTISLLFPGGRSIHLMMSRIVVIRLLLPSGLPWIWLLAGWACLMLPFHNFVILEIYVLQDFIFINNVKFIKSHSYLTGVTTAQGVTTAELWWHLSNMNSKYLKVTIWENNRTGEVWEKRGQRSDKIFPAILNYTQYTEHWVLYFHLIHR